MTRRAKPWQRDSSAKRHNKARVDTGIGSTARQQTQGLHCGQFGLPSCVDASSGPQSVQSSPNAPSDGTSAFVTTCAHRSRAAACPVVILSKQYLRAVCLAPCVSLGRGRALPASPPSCSSRLSVRDGIVLFRTWSIHAGQ